ncbi:streptomycin 3'-adenylyltransferase [Microbacterium sp. AK009]|uniref:aminoglycoside adenylyltransferase domain-containing protein n=1 Tax=Microbacterium sp. AK009 TaxID=2723068 RepID=UPI0015CA9428|nr:aminoglycoside adenylyltransferase domain-containing protein [Microbacterium sp. AK009]NYF15995.1 streptomycin 3'-adenylyltransferase [Microbacterium sp. AK009]
MKNLSADVTRQAEAVQTALRESLVGLYLYGSAVAGGLRAESDVDLLAVISSRLEHGERAQLIAVLLHVSGRRAYDGPARPVELTVMLAEDLDPWRPVVQLQYGEWLRDDAIADRLPGPHVDPDATLLLAMARDAGISLFGPSAQELLPDIPHGAVRSAIVQSLPSLMEDLDGDERNVVLTLARMQATLDTGRFLPKDAAAEELAVTAPTDQAEMLRTAAAAYRGEIVDDWDQLAPALKDFVARVSASINAAS